MQNSAPQIGEGRYVGLQDGTSLLRSRDKERLNDRLAWLPEAERGRILEEAWFKGPEIYDQIDDAAASSAEILFETNDGDGNGEVIYEDTVDFEAFEGRFEAVFNAVRFEGMRNKTGKLARECVDETLAIVDELRGVVRRHARAAIIVAGLAAGAGATWAVLNTDPVSLAHAASHGFQVDESLPCR